MQQTAFVRLEDLRLITGQGRYTADLAAEGVLHAAFVRSPYASARLEALDVQAAHAVPGVVAVLTAADLAADGIGPFSAPMKVEGPDGRTYVQTPRPHLIDERVRFVGEPLALVVAETPSAAADGAEAVSFDLQPLAAVVTAADALKDGAPVLWDHAPDNVAFHWRKGDWDAVGEALGRSSHVTRLETAISRVMAAPIEPRNALAVPDAGGTTALYLSHQNAQAMRQALVNILSLDPGAVRVVAPDVGGSFGMKSGPVREEILVVWAARRLGRPVRWIADRVESFLSDEAGRDIAVTAELGLDADGTFTALRATLHANVGAYASGRSMVPILNIGGIAGVYRTPKIAAEIVGVFSNTAQTAPYRGAGRPEATFVIERVIDAAARETGIDPFELRMKNIVPAEAMPYDTPFLFDYDCGDFARNMTVAAERADYVGFAARREEAERRGRLRGIGIANPVEVAGGPFGRPGTDFADVEVHADGTITVYSGSMSAGQGLETAMIGVAARALGLPPERFRYVQGDTASVPKGKGMGGSAGITTGGSAMLRSAERLIEAAKEIAAEQFEAAPGDVEYEAGEFRVAGTDRTLSLAEVARAARARPGGEPLAGHGEFTPEAATYPSGCHICEVEIDPETGACEVASYVGVEDIGRVLYPTLVEGQIHGGVAQGLGQALCEVVSFEATGGQVLSASFMDYAMPRAGDLPPIDSAFTETLTALNPLGVKGVGEAGTVGALAAGVNAVCDALASAGVTDFSMPATPGRVWEALHRVRKGSG